jgi:glycosyltransferase involved in cell wall biosynthesis
MPNKPLVSVIIIFLNEERFIQEAIESVFAQTYDNWELLLVDDGSTDRSTDIALRYAEQYLGKVYYLEHNNHQNLSMSPSRNLGIKNAKGEYIAFLDADDVWLPHKLEQQVAILDSQPEVGMVYGAAQYWYSWTGTLQDSQLDFISELGVKSNSVVKPPTLLTLLIPNEVYVGMPSSIMLRREIVERIGVFEEDFHGIYQHFEDAAFLSKVYLQGSVFVTSECFHKRRVHPDSYVSMVKRAGQYHTARLFFLKWLKTYLSQQGCKNREVLQALREGIRPYRHARLYYLSRRGRQLVQYLKGLLRTTWMAIVKPKHLALPRKRGRS